MTPEEAIRDLERMQRFIAHGSGTFKNIADVIRKLRPPEQPERYVVRFFAKEAVYEANGKVLTAEGDPHWVTYEPGGWVPATSCRDRNGEVPSDAKVWETETEAHGFMREWGGHPWYAVPESYEVLAVRAVTKPVFDYWVFSNPIQRNPPVRCDD